MQNLITALDAFIAKAEEDLSEKLELAGFAETAYTVAVINKLEHDIDMILREELKIITNKLKENINIESWRTGDITDEEVARVFRVEIKKTVPKLANSYIAEIDNSLVVSQITKRTTDWIESWSGELGKIMKLTTHTEIEKILLDNLQNGKSIADLTRAIYNSGLRNTMWRARRVALTEVLRAHSVAQHEALLQNPAATHKKWVHSSGFRIDPRDNHMAIDGQIVEKDKPFKLSNPNNLTGDENNDYGPMYPRDTNLPASESVNCHCNFHGIADESILSLSPEKRKELQQKAIDEDDREWLKELDRMNRAKAGIE